MTSLQIRIAFFLLVLIFSASSVQANNPNPKFRFKVLAPAKTLSQHRVGSPLEFKFKFENLPKGSGLLIFIEHASEPPWRNRSGPLTLGPIAITSNIFSWTWDGAQVAWAPTDVPELTRLKPFGEYRFVVKIYNNPKVVNPLGLRVSPSGKEKPKVIGKYKTESLQLR